MSSTEKQWALVEFAGTDDEAFYCDYPTWATAMEALLQEQRDGRRLDIMKIDGQGNLTTEF